MALEYTAILTKLPSIQPYRKTTIYSIRERENFNLQVLYTLFRGVTHRVVRQAFAGGVTSAKSGFDLLI